MSTSHEIPKAAWKRRLDDVLEDHGLPKGASMGELLSMLGFLWRLNRYEKRERRAGRIPLVPATDQLVNQPYQGVPLGGLGGGSIGRGYQGDFSRWQIEVGPYAYQPVAADQFSAFVRREDSQPRTQVLYPGQPERGALNGWAWNLPDNTATYHALFPRAWTTYNAPDPGIRLTCRQISPVIPHDYETSSTPAAAFVWTIENIGKRSATVGLMFTFQNGMGGESDQAGGHVNQVFQEETGAGTVIGVALHHQRLPQEIIHEEEAENGEIEEIVEVLPGDPLTFAIATMEQPGVTVTYRGRFTTSGSGMDVWGDFAEDGKLENTENERASSAGLGIGGALAATVEVPAGETREIVFALAWDQPLARFGSGTAYYRRYTRFYGREGNAAPTIVRDALLNYPAWEEKIDAWQKPILEDTSLPDWYKTALFNELYYLVDGGTVWTDGKEGEEPQEDGIGQFAYLECHDYLFYNTYDVHFYASFALAMLWPELEISLQRDFVKAIFDEIPEEHYLLGPGRPAPRKLRGAIPHDLGSPLGDPWVLVNDYNIQDINRWKDLNSKFVLQVYRDFVTTGNEDFLKEAWEAVKLALEYLAEMDEDEDGLPDNEGFPDQTYDTWTVTGASAYCGGLWLAALSAAAAMAEKLGEKDQAEAYRQMLEKGQTAYEEKLWNGEYYNYDSSESRQHDSIMADQLAGQWYARACGLPPIVPEDHILSALKKVYDFNVRQFADGEMGAVNGMRPEGAVDTSSMQPQEVWVGTTYALAAAMIQEGLETEAFATAKGLYTMTYRELGYWFATPEAWNINGDYRATTYMRPLAVWAMQWAWERR